jgi:putative oxidoreductase
VSTEDDRGYFTTSDSSSTTQNFGTPSSGSGSGSPGFFDDDAAFSSAQTTTFTGFGETETTETPAPEEPRSRKAEWHGGLDFGLLVLRLALGGLFVAHGLDQLFGWLNGPVDGMDATRQMLTDAGFTEPGILAWVLTISEIAGGALVVLGLFFPVGAAAILAVMANVIVVKGNWNQFLGGVELEMIYAAAAFGLLFAGPGRVALDRHTPWWRRAPLFGLIFLVIAAGLSVVTLVVWR